MKNNNEQFTLIALDSSSSSDQSAHYLSRFQHLMNSLQHFNDSNACVDYITNVKNEKILLIISVEHTQMIPTIYHIHQIYSIYIFNLNQCEPTNEDILKYRKVRGHFGTINELVKQIEYDKKCIASNLLTVNIFPECTQGSYSMSDQTGNRNMQEATFMYSQIIRNIFINENYKDTDKNEMVEFFREQYNGNKTELEKIDKFSREYTNERAIYWYTIDGFLYRTINKALRTQDIFTLYHLRYFIKDLHLELKKYHSKQHSNSSQETFVVYRGLGLPRDEFEKLKPDHLISFSEFLSTSKNRQLAEIYVQRGFDDMESILFEIELNYRIPTSTPFADISEQSQFDLEEEILLSMGSVFRIRSLTVTSEKNWNIKLIQTSDEDQQLKLLYQWLDQAIFQVKHLYTKLSSLMLFIYDYDKAEFFLRKVLSLPDFNGDIEKIGATSSIFGEIYFHQKKYEQAILLYQKTIELFEQYPDKSVPSTIQKCYTGLSEIYLEEEQYVKALEYSQKSLDIILSDDYMKTIDLLLATRYNNIGHIYYKLGNVERALNYIQKALDYTKSLPSNIPIVSRIFCNLAMTYEQYADYPQSEMYWKKGLEHHLKSMPNNTDATAYLFQAVAINLSDHKKYKEAIEYLKKSLAICKNQGQHALSCCYKNLAIAYHGLEDFQQAAEYLQKAIDIAHTLTNIDLGTMYTDSGNNYYQAQNYEQALVSYSKALEFSQPNAQLATKIKIFIVYTMQHESNRALEYYELHIKSHMTQVNLNDDILIHYYIGVNYYHLKDNDQALKYLKTAQELILPNKSDVSLKTFLIDILKKIASIYISRDQWSEAATHYAQLLEYHPTAEIYMNIG
ncbi:unnamed protein product [Rotaria socialis]